MLFDFLSLMALVYAIRFLPLRLAHTAHDTSILKRGSNIFVLSVVELLALGYLLVGVGRDGKLKNAKDFSDSCRALVDERPADILKPTVTHVSKHLNFIRLYSFKHVFFILSLVEG